MLIAPTARIDPGARLGEGVSVGEYCVIESDVVKPTKFRPGPC